MGKRPFLVLGGGECVPLEGPYRVESVRGDWYVLGEHQAHACRSEGAAHSLLTRLEHDHSAHALVADALDQLPTDIGSSAHRR